MWFKNLHVYRFTKPFELSAEELNEQLEENSFQPCGSQDLSRYGWVPPLGRHGSELIHAANGYIMVCAKRQDKVLPAAVVNEAVEEQVEKIQKDESRSVGRKERQSLKEDMTFTLLPRAFTRSSQQFAYIAPREGLLVVNSSSAKRAEELLNCLRDSIGSLPVVPITAKNIPQHAMTSWLRTGEAPRNFELGHECELRSSSDESSVIRCKHLDLCADEVNSHIKAGMFVSKIGLSWEGGIECVVDDQLTIKRLVFDDIIQDKAHDVDAQDAAEQFDVDFSIMTLELSGFIAALLKAFGGEDLSDCEAES